MDLAGQAKTWEDVTESLARIDCVLERLAVLRPGELQKSCLDLYRELASWAIWKRDIAFMTLALEMVIMSLVIELLRAAKPQE